MSHEITTLRKLVEAWQAQAMKCRQTFDAAVTDINRELEAVGGYATTSPRPRPNDKSYCQEFWRQGDSFGSGVTVAGEPCGPHDELVAPVHAEVGDRCFALEQVSRKEAMALTESMLAIRRYVVPGEAKADETTDLACTLALALVTEERSERTLIVEWLRRVARNDADNAAFCATMLAAANAIEREDHLQWIKTSKSHAS